MKKMLTIILLMQVLACTLYTDTAEQQNTFHDLFEETFEDFSSSQRIQEYSKEAKQALINTHFQQNSASAQLFLRKRLFHYDPQAHLRSCLQKLSASCTPHSSSFYALHNHLLQGTPNQDIAIYERAKLAYINIDVAYVEGKFYILSNPYLGSSIESIDGKSPIDYLLHEGLLGPKPNLHDDASPALRAQVEQIYQRQIQEAASWLFDRTQLYTPNPQKNFVELVIVSPKNYTFRVKQKWEWVDLYANCKAYIKKNPQGYSKTIDEQKLLDQLSVNFSTKDETNELVHLSQIENHEKEYPPTLKHAVIIHDGARKAGILFLRDLCGVTRNGQEYTRNENNFLQEIEDEVRILEQNTDYLILVAVNSSTTCLPELVFPIASLFIKEPVDNIYVSYSLSQQFIDELQHNLQSAKKKLSSLEKKDHSERALLEQQWTGENIQNYLSVFYTIARNYAEQKSSSDFQALYGRKKIFPHEKVRYTKPILFLSNEFTQGGSELLCALLTQAPHVIHIGRTTGGFMNTQLNVYEADANEMGVLATILDGSVDICANRRILSYLGISPKYTIPNSLSEALEPLFLLNKAIDEAQTILEDFQDVEKKENTDRN